MKAISLMYHDVVADSGDWDASGFAGRDAALYKHTREQFAAHVEAIARAARRQPTTINELRDERARADVGRDDAQRNGGGTRTPLLLTFDDGGRGAHESAADLVEARGWRGHFFVTAGRVGSPTFMTREQLRDLRARGHVVGSHSYSHPARMSALSDAELFEEWSSSLGALSDALGEPVTCASVPGGYFSRAVAEAASRAGVRVLFTSEPTARAHRVGECLVLGRYTILRRTPPREAAALAAGAFAPRAKQVAVWNAKKVLKWAGGEQYLRLRKALLGGR